MFCRARIQHSLNEKIPEVGNEARAHLAVVQMMLDGRSSVIAASKPLNRYSILPGKTFAANPASKEKYKVLRVIANDVVVQDLQTKKIQTFEIDQLLADWTRRNLQEVSLLEDILQTVKLVLGPVLGVFLTTALIGWLTQQIGK